MADLLRQSSIEQFCSTNLVSSLHSIDLSKESDKKSPGESASELEANSDDDEDNDEDLNLRPRAASIVKKESPLAHLRVPKLNIAILVCGTRGDVQPFVLIGLLLKSHGHRVRLATHDLYEDYVLESGLEFYPLSGDPKKLSAHMVETGGRLLPLTAEEVKAVPEKQQMLEEIMRSTFPACTRPYHNSKSGKTLPFRAEAIISNPVTYGHLHVAEYLDVPLHLMFPQPWSPTSAYPHPLSSVHDPRFYFSPTSPRKSATKTAKEDAKRKAKLRAQLQANTEDSAALGQGSSPPPEGLSATDYALYYDVRLTNRLSYKVADEFMWMGLRKMTNDFRVDLQTRLRVELKVASMNIHKKAGCITSASSHGLSCSQHSAESSLSSSLPHTRTSLSSSSHLRGSLSSSSHGPTSSNGEPWVGLDKIRAGESGANIIHDLKIPFAKMWSAALVPTPNDYGDHIDIIGNVFAPLQDTASYKPPEGLLEWLQVKKDGKPDPPIFVGFGSMIIKDAASLISTIEKAAALSGKRVLLQSSWTDLTKKTEEPTSKQQQAGTTIAQRATQRANMFMKLIAPEGKVDPTSAAVAVTSLGVTAVPVTANPTRDNVEGEDDAVAVDDIEVHVEGKSETKNETVSKSEGVPEKAEEEVEKIEDKILFHIGGCPHEWLFPHVAAVVHHGGAGTVAAGLRAGKPTIVCPFFGDQFFWGVALERSKVGMNLGAVGKLTPQKLADGFKRLSSPEMSANAQQMAKAFEVENGAQNAVDAFYRHLPVDAMVCDVGVWQSPSSPVVAKFLVHLGVPHSTSKTSPPPTPCGLHVTEAVFDAICRRFKHLQNCDDVLVDSATTDEEMVDVVIPPKLVTGNSFIFSPRPQEPELKVTVPKGLKGGDTVRVKLPPKLPFPKAHPQPGEWQCPKCTALNSPAAISSGCVFCSASAPIGDALTNACAGAAGLRREEGVEKAVRKSENEDKIAQQMKEAHTENNDEITKTVVKEAEVVEYEDSEEEADFAGKGATRERTWSAIGMDLVDPIQHVEVYRGACAWIPPTPKDVTAGIYQGTTGFVAKTAQALSDIVVGDLSAGGGKFKQALTTLAVKPMQGFKGRDTIKKQPRERLMSDPQLDAELKKMNSKSIINKKTRIISESEEEDEEEDEDEISDLHNASSVSLVTDEDESLWRSFDAAVALAVCWGRYIGQDVRAQESHRLALCELLVELGYSSLDAARTEADAQHQWDSGYEVSAQEVAVFLATKCGPPPAALSIAMRHAAERHRQS